ncbi:MAG: glutaredoxin family protein [Gammaproteobacteria bacterium]|nr:glutaredoxin family protein [Gammaproteobacteria bacterium]
MNDPELILYIREGCHLCDDAMEILWLQGLSYRALDISGDAGLEARYGTRIPVLGRGGEELNWPFGPADVEEFAVKGGQ